MKTLALALVGIAALIATATAIIAAQEAHRAQTKAENVATQTTPATHDMTSMGSESSGALRSYAGAAPPNADDLAAAHTPFDATLPPVATGEVAKFTLALTDRSVEIAPGVEYSAWAWANGAPGPVIHVRQGQTVQITLRNDGAIPHSVDFHAARIAPNKAFVDVFPGKSLTYSFVAKDAGVFMYHCGTKPVIMHIANGMYGAIVVDPVKPLPKADKEYVLVSSEWYLGSDGLSKPATFDMAKAHAQLPDWVTWNGYAGQYAKHPLTAKPGENVRFYVVAAGPSFDTDFHIVGTILDRAWVNADVTSAPQTGVQTVPVPAGGGGVFDVEIDEPGLYPFVSHSFASVDLGQVGLLKIGNVQGTMSH